MNKRGSSGGLKGLVIGIVLIVMATLFIFSFVQKTITEANPDSAIFDAQYKLNESISTMDSVVDDFKSTSANIKKQIQDDKPTASDYTFLLFKGAFYIPVAFITFVFSGMKTITESAFPQLGGTGLAGILGIALEVMFATVIITMVLLIVKAIRSGESSR